MGDSCVRMVGRYRVRGTFATPVAASPAGYRIGGSPDCLRRPDDPRWSRRT
ncbi:hypothetical protein [Sphaerimonospora mesophila]|uniref:hypothetical protein n=1 Tax=Sphaerimonospora mesophila TaxID=37483 RepID=UPI000AE46A80